MNEATTPAEGVPFALVDENGHLTGKPAEGVQAAIAEAVAAIPTPEAPWSQTDFDDAVNTHYENLMKAILASTNARMAIGEPTTQFWGNAWAGTPDVFRRIIEKMADMQNPPTWSSALFEKLMGEYPEVGEPLIGLMQEWQGTADPDVSEQIGRDGNAFLGFILDLFVARQALKVMGVEKLEVVGDNLRVTKNERTGSVPITWDAA